MKLKTKDAMHGRWISAFQAYGLTDKQVSGKHCPCPVCSGKDRFRIDIKDEGGKWHCNQCGTHDGFQLLIMMTGRSFQEIAQDLDQRIGNLEKDEPKQNDEKSDLIKRIGEGLTGISDIDPVSLYLRSRGITKIPREFLRFNRAAYHWGERRSYPAMVAALRDADGKARGYHVTYLNERGTKADVEKARLYTPGRTGDCVIRLSAVANQIALAEGIETALSVTQLYGIPCWATGDAGRLERFVPPEGVEQITIFPDIDANHTGEAAAEMLAKRLIIRNGIQCDVRRDCVRGTDYNDLLITMSEGAKIG